ncbi:MAG TPA: SMC-Scp complex subunit ScpB [Acidimicrobiia bacterium]|nr:SMC-Scp complex subunit ScpB [Acidimicrobiia bacterium]
METVAALEAILFVTETPIPVAELSELLEMAPEAVEAELAGLASRLDERGSGLTVRHVGGGWRLYTRPETHPYLERFAAGATARKLSAAALEVLSVVAYRQPVSRGQIAEIRGVDSESSIRSLERLGLIEEAGRLPSPGNPAVYRTSEVFLEKLGLNALDELPPLAEHVPPASVVEVLEETFRDPTIIEE